MSGLGMHRSVYGKKKTGGDLYRNPGNDFRKKIRSQNRGSGTRGTAIGILFLMAISVIFLLIVWLLDLNF